MNDDILRYKLFRNTLCIDYVYSDQGIEFAFSKAMMEYVNLLRPSNIKETDDGLTYQVGKDTYRMVPI